MSFKDLIPDALYLKHKFRHVMGYPLNLAEPKTFNEKLQWLKLHDHRPEYTTMVDKYAAKQYVADRIGPEYIIPTLGVWEHFDEIDFDALPDQFVLKCTHDSGGLVICRDKSQLDMEAARAKIEQSLETNFYYMGREWPYKNVPPRVIAEQYMADDLRDFKLFCFDGVPRMTLVCSERFSEGGLKEDFYDEAWNHLNLKRPGHRNAILPIERPKQYALMKRLAGKLSETIPFSRIDFYEINERVYFGEVTFYPASGFEGFAPASWDSELGTWLTLPGGGKTEADGISFTFAEHFDSKKKVKALTDYKFFCFDGVADCVMVCTERETGDPKFYFFDKQWKLKRYNIRGKNAPEGFTLPRPDCMDEMFALAEELSRGIPYVRVDLYCIDGQVYFGELTFYPASGFDAKLLRESDEYWGELLKLPETGR